MAAGTEISALLRDLGLTEIEAEAYLALLQASRGEPVSGYRVAKDMGRDPANLAKILAALERRGAVRLVQEKPRLFLPVSPEEFSGRILERLAETQRRAVDLLREFESVPEAGSALVLTGPDQVLQRARLMLGNCRGEALLFASPGVFDALAVFLEDLCGSRGCRVRVLSTRQVVLPGAETVSLPAAAGIPDADATPWLQLVVDREAWLLARLRKKGTPQAPSGWWGEDSGLALVLAATLEAAGGDSPVRTPSAEPAQSDEPEPGPGPVQVPEPVVPPAAVGEDSDPDDGFEFIIRHDQED